MRNCSLRVSIGLLFLLLVLPAFAAKKKQDDTKKQEEIRIEKKTIEPSVSYEFSRSVGRGRLVKAHDGKPGQVKRTYRIIYRDGKPVGKELIKEERTEPTDTLFLMGKSGFQTSRHSFGRSKVLTMVATAYTNSPYENGGSGRTAMGYRADYGHVAVDPRVIPLGTRVYVEGYGFAIASDTGGAIKGNRIDLCVGSSNSAAMQWGRRKVKVHVLSGRD